MASTKRKRVDVEHLRFLAQQEKEPTPLTKEEIKTTMIPSSYKQYEYTMALWSEFTESILNEPAKPTFTEAPTVYRLQLFLRWYAETRTGLLEENVTDTTVRNRLTALKRAVKLHTGHKYNLAENKALDDFIVNDLVLSKKVGTCAYDKPVAPLLVAEDLIRFIWVCDEYQFLHPRARLQLVFSIIIMTLLGMRPGEFIESGSWKHSNEGLQYSDIDLIRYRNGTYVGFLLHLRLRNRKGHRNNKKHSPVMLLYEEPNNRSMCPVTHFLSLALADGVFQDCTNLQEIKAMELPAGSSMYKYRYKPEAAQKPILRTICNNGTVSDDNILAYDCFNNMLKGIGQRAGYQERLSAYCFRRAYARAVERTATPGQRRLLMGHSNDETAMYYISGMVGIDSQSMVHGREQKKQLIEENYSMMAKRNLLTPMPPNSQLTDRSTSLKAQEVKKAAVTVTLSDHTPKQEYAFRRQSRSIAYRKQHEAFVKGERFDSPYTTASPASTTSSKKPLRSPSRYLKALWKFEPERKAIARLLYPGCDAVAEDAVSLDGTSDVELPLEDILKPMVAMANPKKKRYSYASASPTEDKRCGVCGLQFDDGNKKSRPDRMNEHLLQCARKHYIQDARQHMKTQFALVHRCAWNDCHINFRRRSCETSSLHITRHLRDMKTHQCLWNSCLETFESYETLAYHVSAKHRVPNEWTLLTRMHYCYEHDGWCKSDQQWVQHLELDHLPHLNNFCGLIRTNGVVIVAAHCILCLGDCHAPLPVRFRQFDSAFALHTHMRKHLAQLDAPPSICPHPHCQSILGSEENFWSHAESVHGMPPFGPRRSTGKRKTREELEDDDTDHTADSCQDSTSGGIDDASCRTAAGHVPAVVLGEAV